MRLPLSSFLVSTPLFATLLQSSQLFEMSSFPSKPEHRQLNLDDEFIQLPFYGGAKGSILRFIKNKNGSVSTQVSPVASKEESGESSEEKTMDSPSPNEFADNLLKIQKAASQLVAIQQVVKASGQISEDEKKTYSENLDTLGQAAQALAKMNEGNEEDDFRKLISGEWDPVQMHRTLLKLCSTFR